LLCNKSKDSKHVPRRQAIPQPKVNMAVLEGVIKANAERVSFATTANVLLTWCCDDPSSPLIRHLQGRLEVHLSGSVAAISNGALIDALEAWTHLDPLAWTTKRLTEMVDVRCADLSLDELIPAERIVKVLSALSHFDATHALERFFHVNDGMLELDSALSPRLISNSITIALALAQRNKKPLRIPFVVRNEQCLSRIWTLDDATAARAIFLSSLYVGECNHALASLARNAHRTSKWGGRERHLLTRATKNFSRSLQF
jgi:hypothetical protein